MSAQSFLQQVQVKVQGFLQTSAGVFIFPLPHAFGGLVTFSCRCQAQRLYAGQEFKARQQQPKSKKTILVLANLESPLLACI